MMQLKAHYTTLEQRDEQLAHQLHQLEQTRQQMIEAEKMASLGRLVAGVAHEINTPVGNALTAITHAQGVQHEFNQRIANGGLQKRDLTLFLADMAEAGAIIELNLQRAAALVQSFKQIAVDESRDEIRNFNLADYLNEVLLSLSPKLKRGVFEVRIDCPPELTLKTHPGAVAQLLTNLIDNALLHAFEGRSSGTITLTARSLPSHRLQLTCHDNGCGIAPHQLPLIFEPFYTTANHRGGTGLGLNLVYNLVTQTLKGEIQCQSRLGEGTTFILCFPQYLETTLE